MDSTTKRLVGAGLSTLSMVAFAIPGGAPVGVAVMIGSVLFELLTSEPPAKNPAITRTELKAAVDLVKAEIIDAIWIGQADDITDRVLALNQGFQDVCHAMNKVVVSDQIVILTSNDTVAHFLTNTDDYFDMDKAVDTDGTLTALRGFLRFLELGVLDPSVTLTESEKSAHKVRTLALYLNVASLMAGYLKTAVLWSWGREMLVAWQYREYQQAVLDNPGVDVSANFPGVDTSSNYHPPTWNTWAFDTTKYPPPATQRIPNCPATHLIDEIQKAVNYLVGTAGQPGVYTEVSTHLDDLEAKASAGEVALGSGWATATTVTKAQMRTAADLGAKAAGWMETLVPKYALNLVTDEDVIGFGQAVDGLRASQASAMFYTHKSEAGKTLTDIASIEYPQQDATAFAQKLFDANPKLTFDVSSTGDSLKTAITTGTFVKIFDVEAYPYLKPATKGGTQ